MPAHTKCLATLAILLLGCLWSSGVPGLHAADGQLRTWTDAKGKFKIKAKFVALDNGVVTLEKEDGSEIEIELKKLSTADQKFANDAAKKSDDDNPFKTKDDNTFEVRPKAGKAKSGKKAAEDDDGGKAGEPRAPKFDLASADQIAL